MRRLRGNTPLGSVFRRPLCAPVENKLKSPPDLLKPLREFTHEPVQININAPSPKPRITTMDNGLRVVTLDWQSQAGGVGIALNTGSRFETDEENGAAMYCEKMGFKSGERFSYGDIMIECESKGVNVNSQQSREQILFEIEGIREDLPGILEVLSDSVFRPKFDPAEFDEQKFLVHHTITNILDNPEIWPHEAAYTAAYGEGSPLGRSNLDLDVLSKMEMSTVQQFMSKWYRPSRVVVGGLGLDHDRLVEQCHRLFSHMEKDDDVVNPDSGLTTPYYKAPPSSPYQGGSLSVPDNRESKIGTELPGNFLCYSAAFVGFEAPSLFSGRDYYVVSILASLLGSGSSFSSGGPGKGMFTRVYREILSQGFVQSGQQVYAAHYDGGIFGLLLTGDSRYLARLQEAAVWGLLRLQDITDEEFDRAKNQLMSAVCTNLEGTHPSLDDLLRQVSYYNMRYDYDYHVDVIRSITKDEALALVSKMLRTPPSVITYGHPTSNTVSYEVIQHYIGKKTLNR